jgi:hypothetical protein
MCWCFWIAVVVASGVLFAIIFPRFVERAYIELDSTHDA